MAPAPRRRGRSTERRRAGNRRVRSKTRSRSRSDPGRERDRRRRNVSDRHGRHEPSGHGSGRRTSGPSGVSGPSRSSPKAVLRANTEHSEEEEEVEQEESESSTEDMDVEATPTRAETVTVEPSAEGDPNKEGAIDTATTKPNEPALPPKKPEQEVKQELADEASAEPSGTGKSSDKGKASKPPADGRRCKICNRYIKGGECGWDQHIHSQNHLTKEKWKSLPRGSKKTWDEVVAEAKAEADSYNGWSWEDHDTEDHGNSKQKETGRKASGRTHDTRRKASGRTEAGQKASSHKNPKGKWTRKKAPRKRVSPSPDPQKKDWGKPWGDDPDRGGPGDGKAKILSSLWEKTLQEIRTW